MVYFAPGKTTIMEDFNINTADTLLISIFVLFIGDFVTRRMTWLDRYSIPRAVTGGLLMSLLVLALIHFAGIRLVFDLTLRDALLLAFFSTIGLSAKLARLKAGGRPLVILVICAAVFLFLQNLTGVLLNLMMGSHPAYGVFAGSASFAGGHGTAIAWGQEAEAAGLEGASLIGIAFATFGLVAGGVLGGPIGEWLIRKNNLSSESNDDQPMMSQKDSERTLEPVKMKRTLTTVAILAICISAGNVVNHLFADHGLKLPGFLTAMMIGIIITNLADVLKKEVRQRDFDKVGEVALQLFLAMSLMSMDLNSLAGQMGMVFFVLMVQIVVVTVFATFIVFRLMGKSYDAAVIAAGFLGLGLGATPVAIANMNAISQKYGPSFKAFLVIPLVGAFFIDLLNAVIIKWFFGLPIMQRGVEALNF
ncbi:sodium/glutamate symporter [bacterium]|nr:sodium/glutamate symporter [bacterium]